MRLLAVTRVTVRRVSDANMVTQPSVARAMSVQLFEPGLKRQRNLLTIACALSAVSLVSISIACWFEYWRYSFIALVLVSLAILCALITFAVVRVASVQILTQPADTL